jgi:hypothetical protein
MLQASKPGQPPVRVEKRSKDSSYIEIDCKSILPDTKHAFYGHPEVVCPPSHPLTIKECKVKMNTLTFVIEGGPETASSAEYVVHFMLNCTNGGKYSVPVAFKCYSI